MHHDRRVYRLSPECAKLCPIGFLADPWSCISTGDLDSLYQWSVRVTPEVSFFTALKIMVHLQMLCSQLEDQQVDPPM